MIEIRAPVVAPEGSSGMQYLYATVNQARNEPLDGYKVHYFELQRTQ